MDKIIGSPATPVKELEDLCNQKEEGGGQEFYRSNLYRGKKKTIFLGGVSSVGDLYSTIAERNNGCEKERGK